MFSRLVQMQGAPPQPGFGGMGAGGGPKYPNFQPRFVYIVFTSIKMFNKEHRI